MAELIERRIHKQMVGVRIPEVSESEEVLDHSVGELCCRKENGGQCQAEKVFDTQEFKKKCEEKEVADGRK